MGRTVLRKQCRKLGAGGNTKNRPGARARRRSEFRERVELLRLQKNQAEVGRI